MDEQMSLDGILTDEKVEKPSAPAAPEAAPAEPAKPAEESAVEHPNSSRQRQRDREQLAQGRVRDSETGQYAKAEEKPAEPAKSAAPQQEFTEKEKAFLRAAQEERNKRQALEKRLAEIEANIKAKAEAILQEPAKTFWDDPEAALRKQEQETKTALLNTRLQTAELIARTRYTDFDEKIAEFSKIMAETPGLHQQWLAAPDPAEFAYRLGKNHKELQEAGNLEALKAKIEKETEAKVRAKIEAELKAKGEALAKEREALPGSLSDARSVGGPNRPMWNGPTPMDDILKM